MCKCAWAVPLSESSNNAEVSQYGPAQPARQCRDALSPFTAGGSISQAGLRAMLGAAQALSHAAANGEISREEAQQELLETILGMVRRVTP